MSNALTTNPVYIDTSFSSYKASVASTLGSLIGAVICVKIRWVAPSAASQTLEIIDPQGGAQLAMLTSVAAGTDVEESFNASPRIWRDFGVIIPSGKAFLFIK
jgi:hypothetical protein